MARTAASIVVCFEQLSDPRRTTKNKLHGLLDILVIALCAIIAGCDSAVEIEAFGRERQAWLRRFLSLPNGIPSHDTFSRVLAGLDSREFQSCFVEWVNALHEVTAGEVVSLDGKTLRRSFDKARGLGPLHVVTAWAAEARLVLGETAVDVQSNEITAIPRLLEILELSGAVVTIDAMGCQREIAERIRAAGADYVLAVKDNQPTLYADVRDHFERVLSDERGLPRRQRHVTREKSRGRREERHYYSTPLPESLRQRADWRDLTSLGWVVSFTTREGKTTGEVRAYISSLPPDAKRLAHAVRSHWSIENSQHWVLDVVFNEDQCRARLEHAAENYALLRRIALNLVRREPSRHASLRVKRRTAGWNNELLLAILTAGTS